MCINEHLLTLKFICHLFAHSTSLFMLSCSSIISLVFQLCQFHNSISNDYFLLFIVVYPQKCWHWSSRVRRPRIGAGGAFKATPHQRNREVSHSYPEFTLTVFSILLHTSEIEKCVIPDPELVGGYYTPGYYTPAR